MKKFFCIILAIFLISFLISPVSAHEHEHEHGENEAEHTHALDETELNAESHVDGDIGLMYIPCPEGGKHQMAGKGMATVEMGNGVLWKSASLYQCSKCLTVLVSDNNYFIHDKRLGPGDYILEGFSYPIGAGQRLKTNQTQKSKSSSWLTSPFDGMEFCTCGVTY
ncbi:hypothetical protein ACFOZY_07745 [Chungangia koreensis]|uniref:Secreted protein n=1 Tax=Chungangia koreensis TaxID=752657 RepID=A0ABV8X311_9LACT